MRKILNIFILFMLAAPLSAESLKGVVVDLFDSKPIVGAVIDDEFDTFITNTDENGEFHLPNAIVGNIYHIHAEGYHTKMFTADSSDFEKELWFALLPYKFQTDDLQVTAEKEYSIQEKANSKNEFGENEIYENLESTLSETIRSIAGVESRSMGNAVTSPVIRAYSGNRVTVNDENVNSLDLSGTSPDHTLTVDAASVREISLMRGPITLTTTNSANGGVLNIERQAPRNDKFSFSAVNSFNTGDMGSLLSLKSYLPVGNFGFSGDGSLRSGRDVYTPDGRVGNTDYRTNTLRGGAAYYSDSWTLDGSVKEFDSKYGVPGGFVGAHPNGIDIEMLRRTYNLNFNYNFDMLFKSMRTKLYRNYYAHKEFERAGTIGAEYVFESLGGIADFYHNSILGLDSGQIGFEYEHRDYKVGGFVFTPFSLADRVSAYFYEETKLLGNEIQFSMRYSNVAYMPYDSRNSFSGAPDRQFDLLSYSISAARKISESIDFGFNATRSTRAPSFEELYSVGPHLASYTYEIGDNYLETEISHNFELFAIYEKNNLRIDANAYFDNFQSYITYRNTGDTNWATRLPLFQAFQAPAIVSGFELSLNYDLSDNLKFETNASYTYGEFSDSKSPLPFIPPLNSYSKLTYKLGKFSFYFDTELASSQRRTDQFELATDSYAVFGLGGDYRFMLYGTLNSVRIDIDNLTNSLYRNHLSLIRMIYPEPGFSAKISWAFGL